MVSSSTVFFFMNISSTGEFDNRIFVLTIASTSLSIKYLTCKQLDFIKEARKGFFGCYSVCETMKDTKEG